MGIVNCEKHGRSGMVTVCPHINEAVDEGSPLPNIIRAKFHFGYFGGDVNAPMTAGLDYCPICAKEFGFPLESMQLREEDFDAMTLNMRWKPVCVVCFSEASNGCVTVPLT